MCIELWLFIVISIYLDFVSLDGESIQHLYDQAYFKLSEELDIF